MMKPRQRKILHGQIKTATRLNAIACGNCDQELSVLNAYKCFYCGIWFCRKCGGEHFGEAGEGTDDRYRKDTTHQPARDLSRRERTIKEM